jgi:hypothetical protein
MEVPRNVQILTVEDTELCTTGGLISGATSKRLFEDFRGLDVNQAAAQRGEMTEYLD